MRTDGVIPKPVDANPKMIRCTVAPGRNVNVGNPTVRWEGDGANRRRVNGAQQVAEPGDEIELPEDEAKFLMSRGFLLDPEGNVAIPNGMGPDFYHGRNLPDPNSNPAGIGMQNSMVEGADYRNRR